MTNLRPGNGARISKSPYRKVGDTLKIRQLCVAQRAGLLWPGSESEGLRVAGRPARPGGRKATETSKQKEDAHRP